MTDAAIRGLGTAVPIHRFSQAEILEGFFGLWTRPARAIYL
jgi:hypothetical protein